MRVISLICNPEADKQDRPTKDGWVDIGHGFQYMEVCEPDDEDETPTGILLAHVGCTVNDGCTLHIPFPMPENSELPGPRWKLESIYPLTISPSVVINECKAHGWIRDGQWKDSDGARHGNTKHVHQSDDNIEDWDLSGFYI